MDDFSVRLVRKVPRPALVRRGQRLVAVPRVPPKDLPRIDVAKLVQEERNRWPW